MVEEPEQPPDPDWVTMEDLWLPGPGLWGIAIFAAMVVLAVGYFAFLF